MSGVSNCFKTDDEAVYRRGITNCFKSDDDAAGDDVGWLDGLEPDLAMVAADAAPSAGR